MKTKQEVFERGIEDELKRINDSYQRCLIKKDKVSLDKEMGNLVELRLKNQANLRVLTSLPEGGG